MATARRRVARSRPAPVRAGFMGLPVRADIGHARAAVLGLPFDCGTDPYRTGSRFGPAAIREASRQLNPHHWQSGRDPLAALRVVDAGDAAVVPGDIAASQPAIEAAVAAIAARGAVPISLGGDGAIALPEMRALSRHHADLVTVHIDAHTDAYPMDGHNTATSFTRAVEERLIDPRRSFQIGMRGFNMMPGVRTHALALGYNVVSLQDLLETGIDRVFAGVRRKIGRRPVYLCFDLDFFDPSVAPGVCSPCFGGATAREGFAVLDACAGLDIVGVSVNTLCPPHDPTGVTALQAATVTLDCLRLVAARTRRC